MSPGLARTVRSMQMLRFWVDGRLLFPNPITEPRRPRSIRLARTGCQLECQVLAIGRKTGALVDRRSGLQPLGLACAVQPPDRKRKRDQRVRVGVPPGALFCMLHLQHLYVVLTT